MIPVSTIPLGSVDDLPDHAKRLLPFLKVFIMILYVLSFFYLVVVPIDPMTAMISSLPSILGTFLLHEDAHLKYCYECLKNSALGVYCCRNAGLSNLAPLFIISSVNSIVLIFEIIPAFQKFGTLVFQYPMFDVLISIATVEMIMAILCWQLLKASMPAGGGLFDGYQQMGDDGQMPMGGMMGRNRGGLGGPLGRVAPAGPAAFGAAASSGGAAGGHGGSGNSFQPFQGQGHKLGG